MFWIVLIIAALFFSWRNYKKNKPLIAARIAEEKEKDRLKDLRRDTRRRQWALACGHRQLAAHVLSSSGGPGPGPRRAGLRLYAHRLSDPLYRRARLVRRTSGLAGVIT